MTRLRRALSRRDRRSIVPAQYRRIIADMADRGAQGGLLGCTELDLLVGPFGLTRSRLRHHRLHAQRAVQLALSNQEGKAYP